MDYIDHYKIVAKIGEGGMGDVYQAFEEELQREVAIKFLKPESHANEERVQRFKQEAIALAKMNHTNIATVYKFGRLKDNMYIVMEFVKGETLTAVLNREGALPVAMALQYTLDILEGLKHAHEFNIIHRDIKPANLIITEKNTVKILDFGIARILDTATPSSKTRYAIGTSDYMSPEQIKVGNIDVRSDIYSVGVVLYQMLTGHLPFIKESDYALHQAHINEKPKSPRILSDDIPLKIANLVLKALEKQPEKRFANADEFSAALQKQGMSLSSDKGFYRIKKFFFDYPAVVLLGLLTLIGGATVLNNTAIPSVAKTLDNHQNSPTALMAGAVENPLETTYTELPVNKNFQPRQEGQPELVPVQPHKTRSLMHKPVAALPKKAPSDTVKIIKHAKLPEAKSARPKCHEPACNKTGKLIKHPRKVIYPSKNSGELGIVRGVHDAY
ncbi:serine/threonine protein kinase [Crenothrix sp.]|uniref:serine/threonine protein kinase n=1 Tax=Crenothrix sp. TaxID=3100433 RepID=UPI00374DE92E